MAWYDRILPTIAVVAPSIAGALGGPVANMATNAILNALGVTTTEEAQKAIVNMNPEIAARMRAADQQFIQNMEQLGVDLKKIEAADRESARRREIETHDSTPSIVTYIIIFGFFASVSLLVFYPIPEENSEVFYILLGVLGAEFSRVMGYYYGSNTTSKQKDYTQKNLSEVLADMQSQTPRGNGR